MYEDFLFLIPARGGSKGIKRKNIRELNGRPLIYYTLDAIKEIVPIENICISSDDSEIVALVESYGIKAPFVRPAELALDTSTTKQVIDHALNFYKQKNRFFKALVLLQPTSPLRESKHILEAINIFNDAVDLVVSVKVTSANPYFTLFEENLSGYLELSKAGSFSRRQDCPLVYERNGAIYIYNLKNYSEKLSRQVKYVMDEASSIDIDNEFDWLIAEYILSNRLKSL